MTEGARITLADAIQVCDYIAQDDKVGEEAAIVANDAAEQLRRLMTILLTPRWMESEMPF